MEGQNRQKGVSRVLGIYVFTFIAYTHVVCMCVFIYICCLYIYIVVYFSIFNIYRYMMCTYINNSFKPTKTAAFCRGNWGRTEKVLQGQGK